MGEWRAEKTITLDNLTGWWLPNTYYLFGDKYEKDGLDDTRTIMHDQRFFLTTNRLDPKVYQVTKIIETSPVGVIKMSLKQDEYNPKRDNIDLMICDYYTNTGDIKAQIPDETILDSEFRITEMFMNENNELVDQHMIVNYTLEKGKRYFFYASLERDNIPCVWNIKLRDDNNQYSAKEKQYLEELIKLVSYNDNVVEVKPGKAGSLSGKSFILCASRKDGEYMSSINLEVSNR